MLIVDSKTENMKHANFLNCMSDFHQTFQLSVVNLSCLQQKI